MVFRRVSGALSGAKMRRRRAIAGQRCAFRGKNAPEARNCGTKVQRDEAEMRLLIYGMQSSGASLLAFLMSQEPETLAIVDCWGGVVPSFANYAGDIVLKTTVKTDATIAEHVEAFKPDFTILVERNILDVRNSLATKYYRDEGGDLKAKLRKGALIRREWNFDFVVDCVIPNYFDLDDFTVNLEPEDYCLFVGRMIKRKGLQIALEAAEMAGVKLLLCGQGAQVVDNHLVRDDGNSWPLGNSKFVGYAERRYRLSFSLRG
jgi:glycosyltransferase involved in cell wall biosynthesis